MIAPLLARDCAEQAALDRTWLLRILYLGGTLAVAAGAASGAPPGGGAGARLFDALLYLQMAGVALVLPVLVAPLVAGEEQRGTLDLVRASPLTPRAFVLQLLAGRLAGMGLLVLGTLPAAALAYGLGGLSPQRVAAGLAALLTWSLLVAAIALRNACAHRSVRTALLRTYLWLALWICVLLPLLGAFWNLSLGWALGFGSWWIYPWSAYERSLGGVEPLGVALARQLPALVYAAFALRWALGALDRRLHAADRAQTALRQRWNPEQVWQRNRLRRLAARGLDLVHMPGDQPLAWRELRRMPLLNLHRHPAGMAVLIVLGGMAALYAAIQVWLDRPSLQQSHASSVLLVLVALPAGLLTSASLAAGAAADRAHGGRDDLLASPLPAHEILRQGRAGARALRWRIEVLALAIVAPAVAGEAKDGASGLAACLLSLLLVMATLRLWLCLCARFGQTIGWLVPAPASALAAATVVPLLLEIPGMIDRRLSWPSPMRFLVWCDQCLPTGPLLAHLASGLALLAVPLVLLAWWQHRHGERLIGRPAAG